MALDQMVAAPVFASDRDGDRNADPDVFVTGCPGCGAPLADDLVDYCDDCWIAVEADELMAREEGWA